MKNTQATRRDLWALPVCFAVLTLLFWTLLEGGFALGFGVIWLTAVAATVWYMRGAPTRQSSGCAAICLIGSLLLTPVYAVSNWIGLKVLVFVFQGVCWMLWLALVSGSAHRKLTDLFAAMLAFPVAGIRGISALSDGFGECRSRRRLEKNEKAPRRNFPWGAVGGIVLAVPVIAILFPILSSADAAFSGLTASMADAAERFWNGLTERLGTLIAAALLGLAYFYPIFSGLFSLRNHRRLAPRSPRKLLSSSFLTGFYGSISLLCLTYLLAQLSYLFNGFLGVLPDGMTAAEYARRGFFEILAFSLLILGLIGIGLLLVKGDRLTPLLSGLIFFLCGFTLLLIATAFAKMLLYVKLYGLTVKRLTVTGILLFLAVLFIAVILDRIFRNFRSLPVVLAAALLLVGTLSYADPHRVVAEYNVWAWESGKLSTVDVELLGELSDGAIPALIRVYESEDAKASDAAGKELCEIYYAKCDEYRVQRGKALPVTENAFAYNVSEHIANNAINQILSTLPLEAEQ